MTVFGFVHKKKEFNEPQEKTYSFVFGVPYHKQILEGIVFAEKKYQLNLLYKVKKYRINGLEKLLMHVKLSDNAKIPTYGSDFSAGMDLYSAEKTEINPGDRKLIKSNISVSLPTGTFGRICDRSGLAYKNGIHVLAGIIDEDYRGLIGIVLQNLSKDKFEINIGDRIAQMIVEKYYKPIPLETKELTETNRGTGGFGSTGK